MVQDYLYYITWFCVKPVFQVFIQDALQVCVSGLFTKILLRLVFFC